MFAVLALATAGLLHPALSSSEGGSAEIEIAHLLFAIATVIVAAKAVGAVVARLGQPRVMGEVLAGILLGPTLLGRVAPGVRDWVFDGNTVELMTGAAQLGLAFYLFLIGLELDPKVLRGQAKQAAVISNVSVLVPMLLGCGAAFLLPERLIPDNANRTAFVLFMGISMSITAFPVLARILVERRMIKHRVGAIALASASIDDVTAWFLLAIAASFAGSGNGLHGIRIVGLIVVFCIAMAVFVRPFLRRLGSAYDEAGHIPPNWIAAIFIGILLSSFASGWIGVAPIFGAFVMGLVMPRRAGISHDIARRIEDFVVTILLPLFFAVVGVNTDLFRALASAEDLLITLALLLLAIVAKLGAATVAARLVGYHFREATAVGILMNTRGLTELIVLNIGYNQGVISQTLFTMLVIMSLATTFMAAPLLRLIDPRGTLSIPPEQELGQGVPATARRSILVTPLDDRNVDALLALAEPLTRSQPPREIIIEQLVEPPAPATRVTTQDRQLALVVEALEQKRERLRSKGIAVRATAFFSPSIGKDIVRLVSRADVDLVLVDGRRPLLGKGIPRGDVGHVLTHAPCDVAVLVEREGRPMQLDDAHPLVVPFSGAEHDWAALELGAWIATATDVPLELLGAAATEDDRDASRLLAHASLVIQQFVGVAATPRLAQPGRDGILAAAERAGLLIVGLSERWRTEGLGEVRATIARNASAPTLFVRRGLRPGALAPSDDLTRFSWSVGGTADATDAAR